MGTVINQEKNMNIWVNPRVIVQMLLFVVAVPFLPLLISWRWDW
jgi:hypothetical protein